MMIKNIASLILLFFVIGCGWTKVEPAKAQVFVEKLLNDLKNENYQDIDQYYTASFNESEPQDKKIEKYKKLREVMGPMQSFELIETRENNDMDNGGPSVALKYLVKCSRITAEETYIVINDEGSYKITFQNIVSK